MFQVVTDQKCEDVIFIQSANYLDRVLSTTGIDRSKLQLLGCACLLIASKMRNYATISVETLAELTDNSFTKRQIKVSRSLKKLSTLYKNIINFTYIYYHLLLMNVFINRFCFFLSRNLRRLCWVS